MPRARPTLLLLAALSLPAPAVADPAPDEDADPIDFETADREARFVVERWDLERSAGTPPDAAARVLDAEWGAGLWFPRFALPFAADPAEAAWTEPMAEALAIAVDVARRVGDAERAFAYLPMWSRLAAGHDLPAWALACRDGLLGRHGDPAPCHHLAALHAVALGPLDPRTLRAEAAAARVAGADAEPADLAPGWPATGLTDRAATLAEDARSLLDAWDRQRAAGLDPRDAADVLDRWAHPRATFDDLRPPLAADAGAWPVELAEATALWVHLGALLGDPDLAFDGLPAWHRVDPGVDPPDLPALAARCRAARLSAPDAPRWSCDALADLHALALGPLDPAAAAARAAAIALHPDPAAARADALLDFAPAPPGALLDAADAFAALAGLPRSDAQTQPDFLELWHPELAGLGPTFDAEIAGGASAEAAAAALFKLARDELRDIAAHDALAAPLVDGGAWLPSMVDGLVTAAAAAPLVGDADRAFGWLAAWAAADPGEREDLPARAARCRAAAIAHARGAAPDPAPCEALADALEPGVGPLHPEVIAARARARALAPDADDLRRAADDPWPAPADPLTAQARQALAAWPDPAADRYRWAFVDFYDVDIEEVLDAWDQDLAAGLTADRAAAAVLARATNWVSEVRWALTPPFPADAGAWPGPMAEALVALVEIGRRTARPRLAFDLLPALARVEDAARPEADVPALSARCRATRIAAQDGRPADDLDACAALLALHEALLGSVHPRVSAERLRIGALHASRGERVAADRLVAEALDAWAGLPTVDTVDEAAWALSRAQRRRAMSLRALARPADALPWIVAARQTAAETGFERVLDGARLLAEEADLAAEAGDQARAVARVLDIEAELAAAIARYEARRAEDELEPAFADDTAIELASAEVFFALGRAVARLDLEDGGAVARGAFDQAWRTLESARLTDHPLAVTLLARLATEDAAAGALPDARAAARRALTLHARLDHRERPWAVYAAAAAEARAAGRDAVAIAWAKAAVDAAERARRDVGGLGRAAERDFLEAHTDVYRALASLLIEAGRLAEADEALRRLGAVELAELTRGRALAADEPMPRTDPERAFEADLDAARAALRGATARERPAAERRFGEAIDRIDARLHGIQRAEDGINAIDAIRDVMPQPMADAISDAMPGAPAAPPLAGEHLPALLGRLGATALLQVVLDVDRTHLVLTTAAGRRRAAAPTGRAAMNRRAYALYTALRDARPFEREAEALYADLIAPVADTLAAEGITTLMVAPDGALRYVPFAALRGPDGRFLVERFAVARHAAVAADVFDRPPLPRDRVAAFGAGEPTADLSALPFVRLEVEGIVRRAADDPDGALPGAVFLDAAFTAEALRAALLDGAPVVHVASHFVFRPGAAADSYLALGGGARLALDRLAGPQFPFDRVELLALSACQTAVGTFAAGQPLDSFSALALSRGARAVVASLWPVADDSTAALMQAFYRHLAAGASKAEALRRAQLALIGGPGAGGAPARKFGLPDAPAAPPPGRHPYAWAPFVLVGDWR